MEYSLHGGDVREHETETFARLRQRCSIGVTISVKNIKETQFCFFLCFTFAFLLENSRTFVLETIRMGSGDFSL